MGQSLLDLGLSLREQIDVFILEEIHFRRLDANNGNCPGGICFFQCIQHFLRMPLGGFDKSL